MEDSTAVTVVDVPESVQDETPEFSTDRLRKPPSADRFTDQRLGPSKSENQDSDFESRLGGNVSKLVWEAGRQQAQRAYSLYANIDLLRPYFDVEPAEVRRRLLASFWPKFPIGGRQLQVTSDLYGPTMVILTLVAVLLFGMKNFDHSVQDGTLMGTAFAVCFAYWFGGAGIVFSVAYVCNTNASVIQVLSILGYALTGHCLTVFFSTIFHSHSTFYILWGILGGLTALKIVLILMSRTHGSSQRLALCGCAATLHLLFLIYLHFAYHTTVQVLSFDIDNKMVAIPPKNNDDGHPAE